MSKPSERYPLYDPRFEHDACGIGAVISIRGIQSRRTVDDALKIVEKLEHRAGKDASGETGDGVGLMMQIPHKLMCRAAQSAGLPELGEARSYGVGMFFFPQDTLHRLQAQKMLEIIVGRNGLEFLGWRKVPVRPEILGKAARDAMPYIMQCFVRRPDDCKEGLDFDRRLYIIRREFEQSGAGTYIPSFSSRTIVYKGMFLVHQLRAFYPDLQDPDCESAMAMVHSRFSTNTNPSWDRAHPNRLLMHNGEINTIRGNVDRMLAREETMHSAVLSDEDMDRVLPVIDAAGSDSSMLDNTLEFLMMNGIPLPQAVMIAIPEPWANDRRMSREKRDFYQYYATMMEAWDGPAAVVFSDGDVAGAVLDRNGLRPCRWYETEDDYLILSSEVGVLDIPPAMIRKKSRLQPGRMLLVDTKAQRVVEDEELKSRVASQSPYGEWLDSFLIRLGDLPIPNLAAPKHSQEMRDKLYKAFGYSYEEVRDSILPMARSGAEPTASMGTDIPLAVLSEARQPLFSYFKQMFAQVTNPPIDAIREEIVTDTAVFLGADGNLLEERAENCAALELSNPILTSVDLLKIRYMDRPGFRVATISLLYYKRTPLERALERLFVSCDRAYKNGANILILSDRGVDENHVAIPSLLAVSAVEQYLIRTKKRTALSIVLESAEPRTVHHFATLLGYGAQAINPYLAHECIEELIDLGMLNKEKGAAIDDYNRAILSGLVKIAAKMGISTIQSYQSAQIFECVGICKSVVDRYFTNTVSRVEGIGLEEIDEGVEWLHDQAFEPLGLGTDASLNSVGSHKLRSGPGKEDHMYNPLTIKLLQKAAREGDYEVFKQYSALVDSREVPHTLRGLLDMKYDPNGGIPLDEVESVESIVKRFKTGAMSFGSISLEAHECLAEAMNILGGKSNSGEGGEMPERLRDPLRCSKIKQIASGRFGVTSAYLTSAQELQIKMAQGAKPGEGGHLPGSKVYPWIAATRCSTPGVALVSPPPHHDIYSIEDLAQLIFDLKNANRDARISVKLVSEVGVGTIASGVAKAGAQVVLISGYDGGTGAAPSSSIHNAGLPWELGLAEAHQTLIKNGLRKRVVLETDGKLMTGRDVAIACMLGAEEFGFATAPLVCIGCCMMRVCNLDTCPAGVATQNPALRKRFSGKPEYVINFMRFVAEELREHMAKLGVRTVDELVGRSDLLAPRENRITHRADTVDLSALLARPYTGPVPHFDPASVYDFQLEKTKDCGILMKKLGRLLKEGRPGKVSVEVSSTDRAFGTLFGSEITRQCGDSLPADSYVVECRGGGGQSFGAFIPKGLTLRLEGDSNDGFGKGLSGGRLILVPPRGEQALRDDENIIVGNVALYGATSGEAYIRGVAGERFCVRNSGASAVVEGVGDHGCEYMTGGRVVILGKTGRNFAAGMSGGVVYVLDAGHELYTRLNKTGLSMTPVREAADAQELRALIQSHYETTGSEKAALILGDFEGWLPAFKKIIPKDYERMLLSIAAFEAQGKTREQAAFEAFYASVHREGGRLHMGKPTGFLDYTRRENRVRPALERVRDWEEFHLPAPKETRVEQGARCMNCGVPFCQAGVMLEGKQFGCPLHNLIPEWNDSITEGNFAHALTRLLKTNNFPEFTGRVCPAFCEQACTCGMYGDAVTVHDNELSIIEYAFSNRLMKPRYSPQSSGKNVAVVGSGPAGLAAADQLNHRGHSVTVIEKRQKPGGLLMYGIPNMKLPKSVVQRRINLMTREGVSFVTGLDAADPAVARRLCADYDAVILCCGAEKPRDVGVDTAGIKGVYYAMDFLPSAVERRQFSLSPAVPSAEGRNVVVIGTGNTASDCVATCLRQGSKGIVQLVRRPEEDYLAPDGTLPQDYAQEEADALFGADPRLFSESVAALEADGDGNLKAVKTRSGAELPCELLIAATGFAGCREDVCEAFGVEMNRTVKTAPGSFQTNVPHIFTAGDMHRGQSLVVHAIAEGRACAAEVDRFLMGYTNLI